MLQPRSRRIRIENQDEVLESQPLAAVIGQAVKQCASAQNKALLSILEGIEKSTFTTVDGRREVAMLSFVCQMEGRQHIVRMPLVSVVPAQFMQIEDVEINFNVSIANNEKKYDVLLSPSSRAIRRKGTSAFDLRNNISVNIRAGNIDMSGGMARLLELASSYAIRIY